MSKEAKHKIIAIIFFFCLGFMLWQCLKYYFILQKNREYNEEFLKQYKIAKIIKKKQEKKLWHIQPSNDIESSEKIIK